MFTHEQIDLLRAPLDRRHVAERTQAGRQLSYIESWHAISEANRIFGFDGWASETLEVRMVAEGQRKVGKGQFQRDGWGVTYIARVRITVYAGERAIIRDGVGSGHGVDADLGQAHESATKEAESDAQKRALRHFGNAFGLALYDKRQANVTDGLDDERAAVDAMTRPAPPPEPEKPSRPSYITQQAKDPQTLAAEKADAAKRRAEQAKASPKPAPESWKDRERKGNSLATAKKLLEGDQNGPGLIQLATDLAAGKPLSAIEAQLDDWKRRARILWRSLTETSDRAQVEKSRLSLEDAIKTEKAARAEKVDPDTGEIVDSEAA